MGVKNQRRIAEELSFSRSGFGSDSRSEDSLWGNRSLSPSNSLQQIHSFPLPGQVPYEPLVSSDGLSPACGPRASPETSRSTGKPRERRWTKGLRGGDTLTM